MSAFDNADTQSPSAVTAEMASPKGNPPSIGNGLPAKSRSHSPLKKETSTEADPNNMEGLKLEEKVGGDILLKQEPGQPPKLTRRESQRVVSRPPQLWAHLPDSTSDALATFEQIEACWYANKYMGYTEHAMECDCAEEWGE